MHHLAISQAGAGRLSASPRRLFHGPSNLQKEHRLDYGPSAPTCRFIHDAPRSACGFSRVEGSEPARNRRGNEAAYVLYLPCGQKAQSFKVAQLGEGSQTACGSNRPRAAAEERRLTAATHSLVQAAESTVEVLVWSGGGLKTSTEPKLEIVSLKKRSSLASCLHAAGELLSPDLRCFCG